MSRVSVVFILLVSLAVPLAAQRPASDWTQWRGPNRDGVAPTPSDAQAWPEKLNQKWKLEVGLGYATPLVVGNRIYQFARKGEREVMMAIDADSGKVLWETGHAANSRDERRGAARTRSEVHSGVLQRTALLDRHDRHRHGVRRRVGQATLAEAGLEPTVPMFTSHSFSPIIDGGIVIFHLGGHDEGAITAFDVELRRREVELAGRRSRLRIAGRGRVRRHASDRDHHAGQARGH